MENIYIYNIYMLSSSVFLCVDPNSRSRNPYLTVLPAFGSLFPVCSCLATIREEKTRVYVIEDDIPGMPLLFWEKGKTGRWERGHKGRGRCNQVVN